MKGFLFFAAASAVVILASPAKADPWTGAYAGAHLGYAWGDASVVDADGGVPYGAFDYTPRGGVAGGTIGYNYQIQSIVVGLEGDLGYLDLHGDKYIASSSLNQHQDLTLGGGLYGDIAARAGILVTPETLLYAKGGFVFYDGEAKQQTTKSWYNATGTNTFTGYVVGGGIERFVTRNISIKIEYTHMGFGDQGGVQEKVSTVGADDNGPAGTPVGYKFHNTHSLDADAVQLGVAYHF